MDINGKEVVMTGRKKGRKIKEGKLYLYHVSRPLMRGVINAFSLPRCESGTKLPPKLFLWVPN